ncbi:prepilin-type N-terminal cleavage/methylation domain-containing protein [Neorhodopirellula pilleata]|uniref:General secretion pathway GspH domain-containing protein n=1 Tax=Neorhodopirellula pilleata TaxID=2714738 RepID=A0A5C6A477_9BACT|nr:prepilin-type N-terminal cleavage/methylation domain-containing protein [Neorhodopirellula pilleata]TWT94216.1 hypothetical protein Pla100_38260 [Neorhodopirellula pilleata]
MKRYAAFTLFELLLVLAILSTLVGTAMPTLQGWMTRARTDRDAGTLVWLVSEAQRRSSRDGREWSIRFQPRPCALRLETDSSIQVHRNANVQRPMIHTLDARTHVEFRHIHSGQIVDRLVVSPGGVLSAIRVTVQYGDGLADHFEADRLTNRLVQSKE